MQATSIDRGIPLPRHWPRRVRSAIVHAVSMADVAFTATRANVENHFDERIRVQAENDCLRRQVSLLEEELRIKDARMERLPAQRRPHYPPIERLAILELRAARGWSQAQTARRLLVTPLTVATWTNRLDEEGPDALVQIREPVSRFPDSGRRVDSVAPRAPWLSHALRRVREPVSVVPVGNSESGIPTFFPEPVGVFDHEKVLRTRLFHTKTIGRSRI
jgi:transcriptional regulator with XRE-family HTH domain